MKSFLQQLDEAFELYEESDELVQDSAEEEDADLEEQNVTGAIAGYSTPNAFRKKPKKVGYATGIEESVNVKPLHKIGEHQRPEAMEETSQDKFSFSTDLNKWPNREQEYPVKFQNQPYGTANIKDETKKVSRVAEALDRKYEQLIEGYRNFATGDPKITPEKKVKSTIQEIAKKLQEIETLVNNTSRLKTESGIASSTYGPKASKALNKISERLIKISERVRSLGE